MMFKKLIPLMLKHKKQLMLLAVAAAIFAVFFIERYFVAKVRGRFLTFNNQIRLKEHELQKNLEVQKKKEQILADYEYCRPYLGKKITGGEQAIAELLSEVEKIAKASGGSIVNLSPQEKPEIDKLYEKYLADIRLELSLAQFIEFLHQLETSKLLIKFEKISIMPKDKEAAVLRADGVVSIVIPL